MLPRIAITPGEPAGIGADILIQLAQHFDASVEVVAIADPQLLQQRATQLNIPLQLNRFEANIIKASTQNSLSIVPVAMSTPAQPGVLNPVNAAYVVESLRIASELCLTQRCHAICTGPVHKGIINDANIPFSGHTEFFAEQAGVKKVVMMLETMLEKKSLRVALASTHIALRHVAEHIQIDSLRETISILHKHLQTNCNIEQPCIMVAGLNPHAGEQGHLGQEEIEIINPVIQALQQQGWDIRGSYPADTMFTPPFIAQADAFLAMYHDQGLPVLKHIGFHRAANISLGLPFIRTSVDHGTALALAGTGKASYSSLQTAFECAVNMVKQKLA